MLMITPCTGKFLTIEDSILPPFSYKPQLTVKIMTCRQKTVIILSLFARHNPRTIAQSPCATTDHHCRSSHVISEFITISARVMQKVLHHK